jgi:hypothetical protein
MTLQLIVDVLADGPVITVAVLGNGPVATVDVFADGPVTTVAVLANGSAATVDLFADGPVTIVAVLADGPVTTFAFESSANIAAASDAVISGGGAFHDTANGPVATVDLFVDVIANGPVVTFCMIAILFDVC